LCVGEVSRGLNRDVAFMTSAGKSKLCTVM
jgi:hypothetical protein